MTWPAISDYELPMPTPPCDEPCELPHKIHVSPSGIAYMKRTVPLVRARDRDVNTIDFGSHGGIPWRPTTSLDKLQKAVRRALNKENT